jgi:hypothetical protein
VETKINFWSYKNSGQFSVIGVRINFSNKHTPTCRYMRIIKGIFISIETEMKIDYSLNDRNFIPKRRRTIPLLN